MDEIAEPSILEYARFHGVASSNLASSDLLDYISVDTLGHLRLTTDDATDDDFETRLSTADTQAKSKQNERLEIGRDGAVFLSSIIKPTAPSLSEYPASTNRHRVKNMKLDTPTLQSDHELDMQAFNDRVISLDLAKLDLPLEAIEEEKDEGLEFPGYYKDFPAQLWESARAEKLDCTREVLLFIQEIRDVRWDGVPGGEVERVKKKTTIEPLTPPLLPLEPESGPFMPSSPAGNLEILSDPETPPVKEYVACEQKVLEMVSIGVDDKASAEQMVVDSKGLGDQDLQHQEAEEPSIQKRVRVGELKVEGPITPPISAKKRRVEEESKSASEILADNAPELLRQPDAIESPGGEILDDHLVEIARAAMDKVEARLNNERLRHLVSTARVQVPGLDSTAIVPPWKVTRGLVESASKDENQSFISCMKGEYLADTFCPMETKIERGLEWLPFSLQRCSINTEEKIEDDGGFQYVPSTDEADCAVADSVLGRLGALQILNDDDGPDREELLPLEIAPETQPGSSTMLEPSAQNEIDTSHWNPERSSREERTKELPQKKGAGRIDKRVRESKRASLPATLPEFSPFQSGFSTANSLSNFMEVRGHGSKRRKLESSPYFPTAEQPIQPDEPTQKQLPEVVVNSSSSTTVESFPNTPLPFPDIASSSEGLTLVLSTALLKSHRFVVHHLESMDTQLKLIFRDYSKFSLTHKRHRQKEMRQIAYTSATSWPITEEDENIGQEAEIILSPSTAILLTTSQETTQLYLPGQSPRNGGRETFDSPIREKIARTCVRYEQLYVLICHPRGTPRRTDPALPSNPESTFMSMDPRTADSTRSLISFCASLSLITSVTPLVVPSQPPELMRWIMGLAYKHARQSLLAKQQEDEEEDTTPELFLRRAGLNPLAAHYILTTLEAQGNCRSSSLAPFINMDPRERRRRFAPVIGERLFARVERRLEMRWGFV